MSDPFLIRLVKHSDVLGPLPIGSTFEANLSYRMPQGETRTELVHRAFRMLKREHPTENSMCWSVNEYEEARS